jgi:primosomal protein N' (replication factor Y)
VLAERFPDVPVLRIDRSTTQRRDALAGHLRKLGDRPGILVGTQILAKGHDLPHLTLVVVVGVDEGLFSADFRAAERLAAQLMQVAGRAGRGDLPGRVLIQTRFASHPLYQAVAAQDYARFADIALAERKMARLPPYTFLALLRGEAKTAAALDEFMAHAVEAARAMGESGNVGPVHVWDPVAAPLARKAGMERGQLLVQSDGRGSLQKFLAGWLPRLREREWRAVKWVIDVDPQDV